MGRDCSLKCSREVHCISFVIFGEFKFTDANACMCVECSSVLTVARRRPGVPDVSLKFFTTLNKWPPNSRCDPSMFHPSIYLLHALCRPLCSPALDSWSVASSGIFYLSVLRTCSRGTVAETFSLRSLFVCASMGGFYSKIPVWITRKLVIWTGFISAVCC